MPDPVADAIRAAAETAIVPRFQTLSSLDIERKSAGDFVTVADKECEVLLETALGEIEPGVPVLGEEAAAADPDLTRRLVSLDAVWVVDPLDGTGSFIDGDPAFAVMVARIERGRTTSAWIYQPIRHVMWSAQLGKGTFREGAAITRVPAESADPRLRGYIKTGQMDSERRALTRERWSKMGRTDEGPRSAGCAYPDLVSGDTDVLVFWRTLPWDHAPGVLIAQEAGCHVARPDGSPYDPSGTRPGLIAAADVATWNQARDTLFPVDHGQKLEKSPRIRAFDLDQQ